ncbi:hypothetical protein CIPAW_15G008400 [Carya illinoinensis]|uniref:Uncharacterized protein n=1 Tax=Carya illinoinensis TaxID=32201 RepID=A0A8T1N3D6_CARIL|nr:hypothetical protein CIPAW_15G008400 [Carya illinoinensis]
MTVSAHLLISLLSRNLLYFFLPQSDHCIERRTARLLALFRVQITLPSSESMKCIGHIRH